MRHRGRDLLHGMDHRVRRTRSLPGERTTSFILLLPFTHSRIVHFFRKRETEVMKLLRVGGVALFAALIVLGAPKHAFAQG